MSFVNKPMVTCKKIVFQETNHWIILNNLINNLFIDMGRTGYENKEVQKIIENTTSYMM